MIPAVFKLLCILFLAPLPRGLRGRVRTAIVLSIKCTGHRQVSCIKTPGTCKSAVSNVLDIQIICTKSPACKQIRCIRRSGCRHVRISRLTIAEVHILNYSFGFGRENSHGTALLLVCGADLGAPFFEPDPLERVPGPTSAGKRPKTTIMNYIFNFMV